MPTTFGWPPPKIFLDPPMPEDDWTRRLYHCLPKYIPKDSKLRLTYAEGKHFVDFQSSYSKVACGRIYLFHGAPDMILTVKKPEVCVVDGDDADDMDSVVHVTTIYPLDSNSESEDDGVIEITRACVPMAEIIRLPKKVGQLIAELHFLALAKVTRNLVNCNHIIKSVGVKGILVDRNNGVVECKLVAKAGTAIAPVPIEVTCIDRNGSLCTSALCKSCQDMSSY